MADSARFYLRQNHIVLDGVWDFRVPKSKLKALQQALQKSQKSFKWQSLSARNADNAESSTPNLDLDMDLALDTSETRANSTHKISAYDANDARANNANAHATGDKSTAAAQNTSHATSHQNTATQNTIEYIEFTPNAKIDLAFGIFLKQNLNASKSRAPRIIAHRQIEEILERCIITEIPPTPRRNWLASFFESLGKGVWKFFESFLDFVNFVGMSFYFLFFSIIRRDVKLAPLLFHINESGFRALPVSLLTSLIVGFAVALQGAVQLELMGAPLLSVETTAKLSLREMGPFILALVIAGRSASSFTAQIGVMQITDEIDAMKTMNLHPISFLVIPRLFALILVMPLLVFLADASSLVGGMIAVYIQLGIDASTYVERLYETVDWSHFWIGIVKAPFFGAAIALVGCFRGFCIKENTQELGRVTTISVVNALFWIIVIDAVFSFITSRLGI